MFVRHLAGMLGISVALCSAVLPVAAQTATPAPAAGAPSSPQSQPQRPQPPQQQQQQGQELPPPPNPPVLPNVPNVAPGYAAPANAPLPTGDLVGVNAPFVG